MNPSSQPGLYQSTNSSVSTLRPRAGRLISYLNDDCSASTAVSTSSATTPPRFPSRGVSPNATLTPSPATTRPKHALKGPRARSPSDPQASAVAGQGLWDSWSSLQGLASTLLGSEMASSARGAGAGPLTTPAWMRPETHYGPKTAATEWGPTSKPPAFSSAHQSAIDDRLAAVQAKKRETLLLASASENRDSLGKYKRRDSDAALDAAVSSDVAGDALVYLHQVRPGDTLAGVIIRYNCQAESFRKINRFWPNDNIQTRTHVLVPVDACAAKGRKVDSPYLTRDLFDAAPDRLSRPEGPTSSPNGLDERESGAAADCRLTATLDAGHLRGHTLEPFLEHDSWVMLPNLGEAVEVLRVPRRSLGHFPRTRRKSTATLADMSTTPTPKSSFDMLRHPPTHAAQLSASLNASPVRLPGGSSHRPSSLRQRSSSLTGGTGHSFADALQGPGGVGTLRGLRTEVSRPGPGDDPLNRKFAQYLPDLRPPESMPRAAFSLRPTPRATPRASIDSVRSTRSNSTSSHLGDVGGAIEGWVRKMAGAKSQRGATVDKMGDLIELETNSEGVDMASAMPSGGASDQVAALSSTGRPGSGAMASASATEQTLLNERFPLHGRVRNAIAPTSNGGKDKGD